MTMLDMITMTVAAGSALECVVGRIAAMDRRRHRPLLFVGYVLALIVGTLAVLLIWQGLDARWLDAAAWGVALYLAGTWGDWRHAPPLTAYRPRPVRYLPGDLVPSSQFDDGRR